MNTEKELIAAWIKYHYTKDDDLFWAWSNLFDLVQNKPKKVWDIILLILEADSSESLQGSLAAGPLEDLMNDHGEQFIEEVELTARQNPNFKNLMKGVWLSFDENTICEKFYEIAGIEPPFSKE